MKLKTLKDMPFEYNKLYFESANGKYIYLELLDKIREEVRQEAIKWLKDDKNPKVLRNWRDQFQEFFNLTEKDLQ